MKQTLFSFLTRFITLLCFILTIAACSSDDGLLPADDSNGYSDTEWTTLSIGSVATCPYNSSTAASRSGTDSSPEEYQINEWVAVPHFNPMRSGEDPNYEGPRIAMMRVRTDSAVNAAQTRVATGNNIMFRVIVFVKNNGSYTFSSTADYTVSGTGAPTPVQNNQPPLSVPLGSTFRVIAFSENTTSLSQDAKTTYAWNENIAITDLNRDFMTYDSGDLTTLTMTYSLTSIQFNHQLSKVNVSLNASGFTSNTISGISGAKLVGAGTTGTWSIGSTSAITASNASDLSLTFSGTSASCLTFPQSTGKAVTIGFGSITVGGKTISNISVSSNSTLTMAKGKSYTMSVNFNKKIGNQIPEEEIKFCSGSDKTSLSKLTWATGNLKSTASTNLEWAPTQEDYGYYYTYNSIYTGNAAQLNVDPCTRLNSTIYGTGWRTPTINEIKKLSRCGEGGDLTTYNSVKGMWFLTNNGGVFLPAAGCRFNNIGSGTQPTMYPKTRGFYWSISNTTTVTGTCLEFSRNSGVTYAEESGQNGYSVRCVKGDKQ